MQIIVAKNARRKLPHQLSPVDLPIEDADVGERGAGEEMVVVQLPVRLQ